MAGHTQVQRARDNTAYSAAYTGPAGELTVNTDDYSVAVHDGATAGGYARLTPGILEPQGRLTLTSGTPVLIADTVAAATLYYTSYKGRWCPIFNGTLWQQIAFSETSLALDSNTGHSGYQAAGSLYDIFAFRNAGVFTIGTGPAWSSATVRGTGAGTTQLQMLNGIWTNAVAITLRFGSAGGNTVSVAANEATYLGTLYATANGQTGMAFKAAAASGGGNPILGLYNAYNRVRTVSRSQDSTANWTYATTSAFRAANASNSNRVSWVDGLGQSNAEADYLCAVSGGGLIAVGFNSTSTQSGVVGFNSGAAVASVRAHDHLIALGFNFAQALEIASSGTATFYSAFGSPDNYAQAMRVSLEM